MKETIERYQQWRAYLDDLEEQRYAADAPAEGTPEYEELSVKRDHAWQYTQHYKIKIVSDALAFNWEAAGEQPTVAEHARLEKIFIYKNEQRIGLVFNQDSTFIYNNFYGMPTQFLTLLRTMLAANYQTIETDTLYEVDMRLPVCHLSPFD